MQDATSVEQIRNAIDELTVRAELARKEGRDEDAVEIEQRPRLPGRTQQATLTR